MKVSRAGPRGGRGQQRVASAFQEVALKTSPPPDADAIPLIGALQPCLIDLHFVALPLFEYLNLHSFNLFIQATLIFNQPGGVW